MADYLETWFPVHSGAEHWAVEFLFLVAVAFLNVCGIHVVGKLTLILLLTMAVPVAVFFKLGFYQAHVTPLCSLLPPRAPVHGALWLGLGRLPLVLTALSHMSSVDS